MSAPLIEIDRLDVTFATRKGPVHALRGVSMTLGTERLGIVGESGSGKSTLGRALMGLLPAAARVTADRFRFGGHDLLTIGPSAWRGLRGRRIGLIMQDPRYALNPVMTVGAQIVEPLQLHRGLNRAAARAAALELLEQVRITDPAAVFDRYPHQISGGMGQRVMIAIALAGDPEVLIADEPTSALDASVRASFLQLLDGLVVDRGLALILISHDLDLVAGFCDRTLVMYGGQVMETCTADQLRNPGHPYTRGLLACRPDLRHRRPELRTFPRDPAWMQPR